MGPERAGRDRWRRDGGDAIVRHQRFSGPLPAMRVPDRQRDHDGDMRQPLQNYEFAGYYVVVSAQLAYTPTLLYSLLGSSTILSAQSTIRVR